MLLSCRRPTCTHQRTVPWQRGKPARSLPQCLTDNAAIHLSGLRSAHAIPLASTSPTGNVVNDALLLSRKLWIHKRSRALDVPDLHFRHRACSPSVTLLCHHSAEETCSPLCFQAQSTLKAAFQSLAEVPYAWKDCISQTSLGLHKP